MYVTDDMIAEMAVRYGTPALKKYSFDVDEKEVNRIGSSQKHGRNHDATLYVQKDDKIVVIAKHFYPPTLYRAPSGGLDPGESFHDGINREMREEIGCEIELDRFLLQTAVTFSYGDEEIFWRSFVFLAHYVRGDFQFTDKREIREVRLVDWEQFDDYGRIMRQSDVGGFHYRAALHEKVVSLVRE
ncbi:MAG: hypothetical protein DRP45_07590 [Candidatus Zixiibacteriota bacterium]|nr:MAG: hypothetical protein DRP45_07590 [candidate division Zixibacteria bacterium]